MKRIWTLIVAGLPAGVLSLCIAISGVGCDFGRDAPWGIENPYRGVKWSSTGRHRANFHTHTTNSDGRQHPHEVVDGYAELGYGVLAITDHNNVTFPWTAFSAIRPGVYEDRDPDALGMVAIEGQELSRHDHTGSLFNGFDDEDGDIERSLREVGARNGMAVLCHPGRYKRPIAWYVDLFRQNPHLTGMEIYNQGDRYPDDRTRWDAILTEIVGDRVVWGHSADDSHRVGHIGRNWNLLLIPELSEDWVRAALESGRFFWVFDPSGPTGASPPEITSVSVDDKAGVIAIQATNYERVEWVSEGRVIGASERLDLGAVQELGSYVRAVVYGSEGTQAGTQPFIISRRPEPEPVG